jgi:hypothetical protein
MTTTQIHKSNRGEAYEVSGERRAVERKVERLRDRLSSYGRVSVETKSWTTERLTVVVGCLYGDGE